MHGCIDVFSTVLQITGKQTLSDLVHKRIITGIIGVENSAVSQQFPCVYLLMHCHVHGVQMSMGDYAWAYPCQLNMIKWGVIFDVSLFSCFPPPVRTKKVIKFKIQNSQINEDCSVAIANE